jgi:hypothetical protein
LRQASRRAVDHGPAAIEDNIRKFRDIVDKYRKG